MKKKVNFYFPFSPYEHRKKSRGDYQLTVASLIVVDDAVLKLKSYEAMVGVANGNATKIIVPSELQGLVTASEIIADAVKDKK